MDHCSSEEGLNLHHPQLDNDRSICKSKAAQKGKNKTKILRF